MDLKRPRILIVDDDDTLATGVCTALERERFRVQQAESAEAALLLLEEGLPSSSWWTSCCPEWTDSPCSSG